MLLMYFDVVHSNVLGDTLHLLLEKCPANETALGACIKTAARSLDALCRPYLNVIKMILAENNGHLASFGPGKTVVAFKNFDGMVQAYKNEGSCAMAQKKAR